MSESNPVTIDASEWTPEQCRAWLNANGGAAVVQEIEKEHRAEWYYAVLEMTDESILATRATHSA